MKIPRCATCNEPIVFIPIVGWQHMTVNQWLDHEAKERP